jgi:antitoxin component YwqK of YwqJK toxin-antitoxin module
MNNWGIKLLILFLLMSSALVFAQQTPLKINTTSKTINYEDGIAKFYICNLNQAVSFKEELEYTWYNEFSLINSSKGGAGGNLLHGKRQFFDLRGNLINETNYYLGLKDGDEKIWDEKGTLKTIHKYDKGKLIYAKFKSNNSDDIIELNGSLLELGSTKKVFTTWGELIMMQEVIKGLKFKTISYYTSGKIKQKYTIAIGSQDWFDGEYVEFYENGQMKIKGMFEENLKTGDWFWYKEDGSIELNEKHRIHREYNLNKKLTIEGGEFFESENQIWVKNGRWVWYKENGKDWDILKEYEKGNEIPIEEKR